MVPKIIPSIILKKGSSEQCRNALLQSAEIAWVEDSSTLVIGDGINNGGVDFVSESNIRSLLNSRFPIPNKSIRYISSLEEMISLSTLKLFSVSFRRDIKKVFVLLKTPSNNPSNWYEVDSQILYGKETIYREALNSQTNYKIGGLPYGSGSCTVKIFSNNPISKFSLTASISVSSSRKINVLNFLDEDGENSKACNYLRVSNNQNFQQDGSDIVISFNNNVYDVFLSIESEDFIPNWRIKNFETNFTNLPDSTTVLLSNTIGLSTSSQIFEGSSRLADKYVTLGGSNIDANLFKESLGLSGLSVSGGKLYFNGIQIGG